LACAYGRPVKPGTRFGPLNRLRGASALVLIDKLDGSLWVITDPFSWMPIYVRQLETGVLISTSLATFLLPPPSPPPVNDAWIYELLYFNYGTGPTTPLSGVTRLPAASITKYNSDGRIVQQSIYYRVDHSSLELLHGESAKERAVAVFNEAVPRYFSKGVSCAFGLSAGLDSRTILASVPDEALDEIVTFTYGIPGCYEMDASECIAADLGIHHKGISLDDEFLETLPALAAETVFLSDGLQNVNRSHLLYVYRSLQNDSEQFSTLMTGISGDHIFRDHIHGVGNVPHMISPDMARQLSGGRRPVDADLFARLLGNNMSAFEESVYLSMDRIEEEYGEFSDPRTYLAYLMYEVGPRYFAGEAAIANSVSTFRNPYWDPDIVALGFQLRNATLGFSTFLAEKDKYLETSIQASVVAASPRVRSVPYLEIPITAYASGNKLLYQWYRGIRKVRTMLRPQRRAASEDWPDWHRTTMSGTINELLGPESRIRDYVDGKFIETSVRDSDVHWLGKLMTVEITLRLIERRWQHEISQ
jgi:asparagine synthetase B (glutamine-hydrolysing)